MGEVGIALVRDNAIVGLVSERRPRSVGGHHRISCALDVVVENRVLDCLPSRVDLVMHYRCFAGCGTRRRIEEGEQRCVLGKESSGWWVAGGRAAVNGRAGRRLEVGEWLVAQGKGRRKGGMRGFGGRDPGGLLGCR
jgi:hypothetical protein